MVTAEMHADQTRADVAEPLVERAAVDGNEYSPARSSLWETNAVHRSAGSLWKRTTARI